MLQVSSGFCSLMAAIRKSITSSVSSGVISFLISGHVLGFPMCLASTFGMRFL